MVCGTSSLLPDEFADLASEREGPYRRVDRQVFSHGRWFHGAFFPLEDEKHGVAGAVVMMRDITELKRRMFNTFLKVGGICLLAGGGLFGLFYRIADRMARRLEEANQQIQARATTDHLTGLHNRRGFLTLAGQQLKIAKRAGNVMLLLYADLDDLKWINDNLGHARGDEAIVEAAEVLGEVFREADILARLGGDEFAVLALGGSTGDPDMLKMRLQDRIDARNRRENRTYRLSMSVGIVRNDPRDSSSVEELMSYADALMYREKNSKRRRTARDQTPATAASMLASLPQEDPR